MRIGGWELSAPQSVVYSTVYKRRGGDQKKAGQGQGQGCCLGGEQVSGTAGRLGESSLDLGRGGQ